MVHPFLQSSAWGLGAVGMYMRFDHFALLCKAADMSRILAPQTVQSSRNPDGVFPRVQQTPEQSLYKCVPIIAPIRSSTNHLFFSLWIQKSPALKMRKT